MKKAPEDNYLVEWETCEGVAVQRFSTEEGAKKEALYLLSMPGSEKVTIWKAHCTVRLKEGEPLWTSSTFC